METSAPGFLQSLLRDSRLSTLAPSALPAWLWSSDGRQLLWANPVGAAMLGATSPAAIAGRNFDAREPAAAEIARLAPTLVHGAPPRVELFRSLEAGSRRALTCACSVIAVSGHSSAILVAAAEPAGPDLPLAERIRRLLAGNEGPIAGFTREGRVLHGHSAEEYLRDASSLAELSLQGLATEALASGSAVACVDGTRISIERIGASNETVLIASFSPSHASAMHESSATRTLAATEAEPLGATRMTSSPVAATSRRHPLRFIWQIDDQGRFTLGSDEFIALTGPRTAAAIGRTWPELEAELHLDPDGQVARAIATRDTWSGLVVLWPVDGIPVRLSVELSGLPVFDRDRVFRGYRGFGVCREEVHVAAAAEHRETRPCGKDMPAEASVAGIPSQPAPGAGGLPPLPGASAETKAPALSPIEHSAFRELSRELAHRLTSAWIEGPHQDPAGLTAARLERLQEDELDEASHHVDLASAAKSDLLAKISNEARTPINSILGFSELMMEERFGPIANERYREYLKHIHASGDQLMSLVNDLLDLAKIEAGQLELAFSDVALDDLARQCVTAMRTHASRHRVIIRTSLWSSPPKIVADAPSLRKIVVGLLSNAIKLTQAGGQVIVSTAHTENGDVVMHVRNTGVGVRRSNIGTTLEPLPQLAISTRSDAAGDGLTLRLTKALTEANHASFTLTGAPREGILVEIAFPASRVRAG